VRNKQKTIYCYSEVEREEAAELLGKPEITRFKGLGEINPREFKRFIGPDMRLQQVTVPDRGSLHRCLEFYMGRNTPERRKFITDELIAEPTW
jgi:DNA gyrase/topoisomerase IV subunit B